jgi:hypothetical protein
MSDMAGKHVFTGYGGVAALLLATYLGMVVYRGNARALVTQLAGEFGFIKWALALVLLWIIIQEAGPGLGTSLALLAFGALLLVVGNKLFPQIADFFKS